MSAQMFVSRGVGSCGQVPVDVPAAQPEEPVLASPQGRRALVVPHHACHATACCVNSIMMHHPRSGSQNSSWFYQSPRERTDRFPTGEEDRTELDDFLFEPEMARHVLDCRPRSRACMSEACGAGVGPARRWHAVCAGPPGRARATPRGHFRRGPAGPPLLNLACRLSPAYLIRSVRVLVAACPRANSQVRPEFYEDIMHGREARDLEIW